MAVFRTPQALSRECKRICRKAFLFGGLLHDCLSVILNVEHSCMQQMFYLAKEFARLHPQKVARSISSSGSL